VTYNQQKRNAQNCLWRKFLTAWNIVPYLWQDGFDVGYANSLFVSMLPKFGYSSSSGFHSARQLSGFCTVKTYWLHWTYTQQNGVPIAK
jgi:hypothetical protein